MRQTASLAVNASEIGGICVVIYTIKMGKQSSWHVSIYRQKDNLVALHFKYDSWHMPAMAGSDVVQSGRPIFDDFFQHLWPYIGNNTANVVFQMVKRLWRIHIDR
ncbi:adhesion G protein-coupled receptor B2 [Trichonephila clavipes]|nr:adhesion G protein-coupled receptor B2 [Trichonephila clavipes]